MAIIPLADFPKDPDAILDYELDWTLWLEDDVIMTSTWMVPDGLTQPNAATHTQKAAHIWLGGGTEGQSYLITNRITTAGGRQDDRTIQITITEK